MKVHRRWAFFKPASLVLVLLALTQTSLAFYLEGSANSFAQFPRWNPGLNGSLELSFLTREPSGLLLYTDDGGSYEFFELKIVDGTMRLRYNLGGGSRLLTTGKNLHDGEWHTVRIQRRLERTELIVDGHAEGRSVKTQNQDFGSPSSNSFVWVGGLPELVTRQVNYRLTLPVVTLEPSYSGHVKDIVFKGADGIPRLQTMIASQVWNKITIQFYLKFKNLIKNCFTFIALC